MPPPQPLQIPVVRVYGGGAVQRQCGAEFCNSTTRGAVHATARQNINIFHVPNLSHYTTTPDSRWWCGAEFGNSSTLRAVHATATQSTGIFCIANFSLHPTNSRGITSLSSLLFVCWLLFYCTALYWGWGTVAFTHLFIVTCIQSHRT